METVGWSGALLEEALEPGNTGGLCWGGGEEMAAALGKSPACLHFYFILVKPILDLEPPK